MKDQSDIRPQPKIRFPIKVIPWTFHGGRQGYALEYQSVFSLDGKNAHPIANRIPIEKPEVGLCIDPINIFAYHVRELLDAFNAEQARSDGLIKEAQDARESSIMLQGQVDRLTNQLKEANQKLGRKEKANG